MVETMVLPSKEATKAVSYQKYVSARRQSRAIAEEEINLSKQIQQQSILLQPLICFPGAFNSF